MVPAVIAKIISMQPSLTMSENQIAQYVINHADKVANSTITYIAKKTGTSEASINRFCKKVGYKGFNGFKVALAQENFYSSIQNQQMEEQEDGTIGSVAKDYTNVLVSTSAMLDEDILEKAVTAMQRAESIYILCLDSTAVVAKDLELKLNLVDIGARCVEQLSMMKVFASNVHENDLVIVIVPTILMKDIYQTVVTCKDRGAKILTITSYDSPKLNQLVDYKFVTSDKITTQNAIALSNNLAFLYTTDVIYCAMLQKDKSLLQKKLASDVILSDQNLVDHYMLEY